MKASHHWSGGWNKHFRIEHRRYLSGISQDSLGKRGHSGIDEREHRLGWGGVKGNGEATLTGGPGLPSKPEAPWTKGTVRPKEG